MLQTVVGQFPRISFLSISFLSISCTAMLPFLDKSPILCEAHHLLSPKLSGKLLSITYQDSFNGIYGRWALLCLLWFPWLFHTLSMILKPPTNTHLCPYSLSTDEKAEVIIHSTFIQQCTEEKYFAVLLPFQLKENISSFLLLSIISSESQPSHIFRDQ